MAKEVVRLTDWPFKKGERTKLVWIAEPFRENNKWMVKAYFKGEKSTKEITLDWANVHFLIVDKYYVNGDLNSGDYDSDKAVVDIDLTNIKVNYREKEWEVWWSGEILETKSKTFSFFYKNELYVMPIIEIIRSVLAPNRFLLNRILEMDTLENYFVYEIERNILSIHFTSQYNKDLLKSEKINHLAWLLTNPHAFQMFNMVGQSMWQNKDLKLEFLLSKFSMRAKVERHEKYIKILEIIGVTKKKINAEEIGIYHPSLEETEASDQIKKRKYIGKGIDGKVDLTSEANGSTNAFDEVNTLLIDHEYEFLPEIKKRKTGKKIRRDKEDETTKPYIIDSGNSRTTADEGGHDLIKGLEFKNLDSIVVKGELEEFIEVLKLLEKRPDIRRVEIIVGELPDGRKFSRLKDGITRRRYIIGKITIDNGKQSNLIEIEREEKALSMLIINGYENLKWDIIYKNLLEGLVEESGKWSSCIIESLQNEGIVIYRNKHINKNSYERSKQIYTKLMF